MNYEKNRPLLYSFFAPYFHQDWDLATDTPSGVVDLFKADAPQECRALAEAILDFCNEFTSDLELENKLSRDLGCEYVPSLAGESASSWLRQIATQLIDQEQV